ncbi:MAG: hypothetical protein ACRD52_00575 [Candidatus Acidiferrales bacterium]
MKGPAIFGPFNASPRKLDTEQLVGGFCLGIAVLMAFANLMGWL